jgi:antirestriction protein ArdC
MANLNAVTKQAYSATNQEHLEQHKMLFGLSSCEWAGFKQWADLGRKVKKGAKGCKIYMVCDKKIDTTEQPEQTRKVVKALYVFNFEHTEEI